MTDTTRDSQRTTRDDPIRLVHRAIDMVSPSIRMVSLRRAAKNIPVPSALDARQRSRQGIQWILKAAERGRAGGQPRNARLAREFMSVLEGTSSALQRKDEVHRLATVNRFVGCGKAARVHADVCVAVQVEFADKIVVTEAFIDIRFCSPVFSNANPDNTVVAYAHITVTGRCRGEGHQRNSVVLHSKF